jgi:ketosteroid isomerase-like protein
MMTQIEAVRFAREWIEAWTARDLERVLSHYTDDFAMSSPFIVTLSGEVSGTLRGKAAVRAYWQTALQRHPTLHFELLEVFVGVSSLVILYKAMQGRRATEVLFLNENGRVSKAMAHYDQP